ncbi:hypothetical protein NC651_040153 [Populus alba x Populus x berolinensis]|nr:hypothetical protein NC651_040153 [Populus alba x Populus x berolinensis]
MGPISLVRYGKYRHQFHLHLHLRSFLASNFLFDLRKSMGVGRKWRRESPTIKRNIFLMGPFSIVRCGKYRT